MWSSGKCASILRYLKLRDIKAVANGAVSPMGIKRLDDINLESVRRRLNAALTSYHRGAYLRFGSRSPKDSSHGLRYGFQGPVRIASFGNNINVKGTGAI